MEETKSNIKLQFLLISAPEKNPIPSDIRQTVFCTVLAQSGESGVKIIKQFFRYTCSAKSFLA